MANHSISLRGIQARPAFRCQACRRRFRIAELVGMDQCGRLCPDCRGIQRILAAAWRAVTTKRWMLAGQVVGLALSEIRRIAQDTEELVVGECA